MCKNRILSPSLITVLALFLCFTAVRVERAAQQDPQSSKSNDKTSNSQSPGQKQESKPTPTPTATGKQSPMQQIRSQFGDQDPQRPFRDYTDLVSLPVTVTDAYNRLVT